MIGYRTCLSFEYFSRPGLAEPSSAQPILTLIYEVDKYIGIKIKGDCLNMFNVFLEGVGIKKDVRDEGVKREGERAVGVGVRV